MKLRINTLAGFAVEALDGNNTWVAAESGASFESREEAQQFIDDCKAAQDVEQLEDVTW